MPTYPIFRCKGCNCAVQMQNDEVCAASVAFGGRTLISSELDSERFADYCKGQGSFYAEKPVNLYDCSKRFQTHFNFSGLYEGMCCYCALGRGLYSGSFVSVGCYQCKRSEALLREFSKLKLRGSDDVISWISCGWSGLSDSVIDLIMKMVVGEKTLLLLK